MSTGSAHKSQLTNPAGDITLVNAYEPYGNVTHSMGDSQTSYGFTGEYTDPTGNIYLRARYYNPLDGRFLSRDTWSGDVNNPLSLNRWNYVEGNPVNYVDPSGYCGRNSGWNADKKYQDCLRLVKNLESAFGIIIYWPNRNNLPPEIKSDITCFCLPLHPWDCDSNTNNITYTNWTLEEIVALGASTVMYQNVLGSNLTKSFLQGVVFIRANGNTSTGGEEGTDGQYFPPGSLRGFGNSPGIVFYDNVLHGDPFNRFDFGDAVWVFTHEIAHRLVSWTNFKYFNGTQVVQQSFYLDVWEGYNNPGNEPTHYSRRDSVGEDIAETITTYLWERQSSWWIDGLPWYQQDVFGSSGNRSDQPLTESRIQWVETYFQSLIVLNH